MCSSLVRIQLGRRYSKGGMEIDCSPVCVPERRSQSDVEPSSCKGLLTDLPKVLHATVTVGWVSQGAFCKSAKHWFALNQVPMVGHLLLRLREPNPTYSMYAFQMGTER